MQEENIGDNLNHQTLARRRGESIHHTRGDQTRMRRGQCLPKRGQDDENTKHQAGRAAAEDVGARDDDEVGVAEREHASTGQQTELSLVEVELCAEQREHGSEGQRRFHGHEGVEKLNDDGDICKTQTRTPELLAKATFSHDPC